VRESKREGVKELSAESITAGEQVLLLSAVETIDRKRS
jgi:hypothetical protein